MGRPFNIYLECLLLLPLLLLGIIVIIVVITVTGIAISSSIVVMKHITRAGGQQPYIFTTEFTSKSFRNGKKSCARSLTRVGVASGALRQRRRVGGVASP